MTTNGKPNSNKGRIIFLIQSIFFYFSIKCTLGNIQVLALMGTRESKGFESEREILYSVLFDMRQEVAELTKMVHNLMATSSPRSRKGGIWIGTVFNR